MIHLDKSMIGAVTCLRRSDPKYPQIVAESSLQSYLIHVASPFNAQARAAGRHASRAQKGKQRVAKSSAKYFKFIVADRLCQQFGDDLKERIG